MGEGRSIATLKMVNNGGSSDRNGTVSDGEEESYVGGISNYGRWVFSGKSIGPRLLSTFLEDDLR